MGKQKINRRVVIASTILFLMIAGVFYVNSNNGLAIEKLPSNIQLQTIDWTSSKQTFFNFRAGDAPQAIEGEVPPTDDPVYFTNAHFTDDYQYAQTAGKGSWTESQRLFWRKDTADKWKEIQLTEKDVYPSDFVSKNGRQYLAVIGGLIAEDRYLYLIDVEKGMFQKQIKANELTTSPDKTKILCRYTPDLGSGFHQMYVFDLESGTETHITNVIEASPGSGLSFNYKWSSDSNLIKFQGTSSKEPNGFLYIYEHDKKKLFEV